MRISVCTTCRKKVQGSYFCPSCGQEGTDVHEDKNNINWAVAKWIDPKERKVLNVN